MPDVEKSAFPAGSALPFADRIEVAIDAAHLKRQTMGDEDVQREVLSLFLGQLDLVEARIGTADAKERHLLAHNLRGAAQGVGARGIASWAERVEAAPSLAPDLDSFRGLCRAVRTFVEANQA